MKPGLLFTALLFVLASQGIAQGAASGGTIVTAAEIAAAVHRGDTTAVSDAVLRVLKVDESQVGVSVVRRSRVNGLTPPDAIVHDDITEVYHIIEGRGVLVTGGTVDNATQLPATSPVVRRLAGPSAVGKSISGGTRQNVGVGDVIVIPPHTAHGFSEVQSDRIVYVIVRIDPHRVLDIP